MGWTHTHRPKGQSIKDFFIAEFCSNEPDRILDCAMVKGTVYMAYKKGDGRVTAIVCLTNRAPRSHFNFGYKDMGEIMGPYQYDCPARILDLLSDPPPNDDAAEWRARCRENLAKPKSPNIDNGDIVKFKKEISFTDNTKHSTFEVVKSNRKIRFRVDGYGLYIITRWRERDYDVLKQA